MGQPYKYTRTSMAIWSLAGFSWVDYVVFALLLVFSLGIGIFYALRDRGRARSTKKYLMAGKSMSVAPATLSFIASFMRAIMLLGASYSHITVQRLVLYILRSCALLSSLINECSPSLYHSGSHVRMCSKRRNSTSRDFLASL